MCYNKNNLLFQLVANNMNMFPIIKSENIETLHLLSALKESVQIDYKKACCYGTSMNKTFWTISWNWSLSILPEICQKTRWLLMFSENIERGQWQKMGYKHSWQRVPNPLHCLPLSFQVLPPPSPFPFLVVSNLHSHCTFCCLASLAEMQFLWFDIIHTNKNSIFRGQ